jgi:hypothetical protein
MERNKAQRSSNADPTALDQIPRRTAKSLEDISFTAEAFIPPCLPLAVRDDLIRPLSRRHSMLIALPACSTTSYRSCSTGLS